MKPSLSWLIAHVLLVLVGLILALLTGWLWVIPFAVIAAYIVPPLLYLKRKG